MGEIKKVETAIMEVGIDNSMDHPRKVGYEAELDIAR